MSTLFGVPVDAAYHLVFALTNVLTPVLGGLAAVVGIIVFTMAVRLLVSPLTFRALRGQAAQARLAPEIQRLRQRHAKQPDRLQRELTALYQREGTSMFAGFAPLLVAVAGVQRAVPAVPLADGGGRPEPAALAQPARRAARQPLAVRRRGSSACTASSSSACSPSSRRPAGSSPGWPGGRCRSPRRPARPATGKAAPAAVPGAQALTAVGKVAAVHHGGDRGLRAPGRRDLPGHLDWLERRRAPGLRRPAAKGKRLTAG